MDTLSSNVAKVLVSRDTKLRDLCTELLCSEESTSVADFSSPMSYAKDGYRTTTGDSSGCTYDTSSWLEESTVGTTSTVAWQDPSSSDASTVGARAGRRCGWTRQHKRIEALTSSSGCRLKITSAVGEERDFEAKGAL